MKKRMIVANWKSNMTISEATKWLQEFQIMNQKLGEKEIIVCPPFTLLALLHSYFLAHNSELKLGAQNVSSFPKGAYTGEVAAEQLKEFVAYVIIGHSERRKYFHEDDQILQNKVDMAREAGIEPIFCVQDQHAVIPKGVAIVAYEPVFAIGTGEPDSPENANHVAEEIRKNREVRTVLYGGSVTPQNAQSFTTMEYIDGVLVGSASLHPESFGTIVASA